MELKQFIEETLISVVEGVEEANKKHNRFQLSELFHSGTGVSGQNVEFDVSVMVNESQEKGKKAGIFVALANLGAEKSSDSKTIEANQNTHRLKFKVFVTEK